MESAVEFPLPKARIVTIEKWIGKDGYGFVLKETRVAKDYRIQSVEANMPAVSSGLMQNDCIIEVNGISTSKNHFNVIYCRWPGV